MILTLLVSLPLSEVLDPQLTAADFCSEKMLKGWAEDKSNTKTPDQVLDSYIKSYNDSIEKHKEKMHFGLHICRGKFKLNP